MKRYHHRGWFALLLFCLIFNPLLRMSYAQKSGEDISIGKYEIIHSEILNEDRTLLIHLPRVVRESCHDLFRRSSIGSR